MDFWNFLSIVHGDSAFAVAPGSCAAGSSHSSLDIALSPLGPQPRQRDLSERSYDDVPMCGGNGQVRGNEPSRSRGCGSRLVEGGPRGWSLELANVKLVFLQDHKVVYEVSQQHYISKAGQVQYSS